MSNIHSSAHPVLGAKLTQLRNKNTKPAEFRQLLRSVTFYLGYEATKDFKTSVAKITTPIGEHTGVSLAQNVAIVPVMRAGLGMVEPMLELLPDATVHHIGMYRSKASLLPVQYYNRLPKEHSCDVAIVLEPMIATAGTISAVIDQLKQWGVKKIICLSMIASKKGLAALSERHGDVAVHVANIDDTLDETGFIVPGLGDAGDRQFVTDGHDKPECASPSNKKQKT